jgi:hypothetical protein
MELLISRNKKVASVQKEFQNRFPFLKIEFYNAKHAEGEGSSNQSLVQADFELSKVSANLKDGNIHISPIMTASELEKTFSDSFDLNIQVFRKSGRIWLQTINTDDLSLNELNNNSQNFVEESEDTIIDSMDRQELE